MVVDLRAGAVQPHIVIGPAVAECVTAGGQLADQIGQVAVIGVAAGFGAQHGHGGVGRLVPVRVQRPGLGVEEAEPGQVRRPRRVVVDRRIQRRAERAGGQQIEASVHDDRRHVGHAVQDALHTGSNPLLRGCPPAGRLGRGVGGAGQVVQVRRFGFVETQGAGDRIQHAVGNADEVAALQAGVVVGADAGQHGDFFAAKPRYAATTVAGQARLLGGDLGATTGEKLADVVVAGHRPRLRPNATGRDGLPLHG